MFKKLFFSIALVAILFPLSALGQNNSADLTVEAGENQTISVNQEVVFSASTASDLSDNARYSWNFGDQTIQLGKIVNHSFNTAGDYTVTLTLSDQEKTTTDSLAVSVFSQTAMLIYDWQQDLNQIASIKSYARQKGVLLVEITDAKNEVDYIYEDNLAKELLNHQTEIKQSQAILVLTKGNTGLNVLAKFASSANDIENLQINEKIIIYLTEENFTLLNRLSQSLYSVLSPQYIMLARPEIGSTAIDALGSADLLSEIQQSPIDHLLIGSHSARVVDKLRPTNFMSYAVNYLINQGVAISDIVLILMLPVIATLIAFGRQILGIKTFGIYTPSIIALSFIAAGLKYGLFIFLIMLATATIMRLILRKFRLMYLPRIAIVLTVVALTIFAAFVFGAFTNRTGFIATAALPILVMIMMVEKFIAVQAERGLFTAVILSLETILVSVACYLVVKWEVFENLILAYPELILLTLVINIFLGKWSGLRLSEYIRFREVRKFLK
ncbi:MAG: hypothetical protein ACD_68C00017G0002 [uncultured bacterium]|nr:MAG: hypothetical protein ACD_68C00017G0002 [uncultured bacterium]